MTTPRLQLNDGHDIPQLGLGTWPLKDREVAETIVSAAEIGYRHIDTAAKYGNEKGVGVGIRDTGIPREEFFVTTKLDGGYQGDDKAIAGLEQSLKRLRLDYVDLLLIHWPLPKRGLFTSTFRTFAKLRDAGLTRSIGVSNFQPDHLETLISGTGLVPAVNQVQLDPTIRREAERTAALVHGIVTESYSPLGQGGELLRHPVLTAVADRHGRTPAQVVLRWHVQNGLVAIPKSRTPERLAENFAVFDFELTDADLAEIATMPTHAGIDSNRTGH
jgi:2,5-diketo-D-gluconate reductase A